MDSGGFSSGSSEIEHDALKQLVERDLNWRVIPGDGELVSAALELWLRFEISVWDSWIVAAAQRAGVHQLWSDSNAGLEFGKLRLVSPLVP